MKNIVVTNKNAIHRLSMYRSALYRFKALGFKKIFSDYLADAVEGNSAQVRKDFSLFGITGNKRGGYIIDALLDKLNMILGKNRIQKVILAGAGNLGSALLKYAHFEKEGIKIEAAFDIDPAKHNLKGPVPVYPLDKLEPFVRDNGIKTAILCVPDMAAQSIFELMLKAGIRGVLNFAPIRLKAPDECVVSHVNLAIELENLIYFVNASEQSDYGASPSPAANS